LKKRLVSEVFEYGEDEDPVIVRTEYVPTENSDFCGESFSGPQAAKIRHEAIGKALGLLSPREIRALREGLGQSLERFATLIGVKTDRLSQWENGTAWQCRTADRLLRLLGTRHENVQHLETLVNFSPGLAENRAPEVPAPATSKRSRRVMSAQERKLLGM
jgi:DNA-binding transcriptional regulator YiaG